MHNWLECYLFYHPEIRPKYCYTIEITDFRDRSITFKTNVEKVYFDDSVKQPPLSPFGRQGYVMVYVAELNADTSIVDCGVVHSLDSTLVRVKTKKLNFTPPPSQITVIKIRKTSNV